MLTERPWSLVMFFLIELSASQCEIIQFSERVRPTVLHLSRPSAAWPLEASSIRARGTLFPVHESNLRLQAMPGSLSGGAKHSRDVRRYLLPSRR